LALKRPEINDHPEAVDSHFHPDRLIG